MGGTGPHNTALRLTASSVRCAPASGSRWAPAFGFSYVPGELLLKTELRIFEG